jgi:tRNA(Ile)-lysidine synthase
MLSRKVLKTMHRFGMVSRGERVVVGLSGGRDSVALTALLVDLAAELELSLSLAHLNHGLRAEADEDERFCEAFAGSLDLPFAAARVDLSREAKKSGRSLEDEGRRARYRFLESHRESVGADRIAVGHTLDDQAETFLLRLFRGSGGRGLACAHPVVDGRRIRPLLELRRSQLTRYLNERGIPFRDDASNEDPRFTRNRVRHLALPRLASEFNPRLVETLGRTAAILRDEEDWMNLRAAEAFAELVRGEAEGEVRLDVEALLRVHPALRRRLLRLSLERVRGDLRNVAHVHVEDVLSLLAPGKSGRELHLPGVVARRSFSELEFRAAPTLEPNPGRRRQNVRERGYNGFEYRFMIPARIRIPESGGTLLARFSEPGAPGATPLAQTGNRITLGLGEALPRLTLRSPRPGDRFRPAGGGGSKTISRYLMDRKVSRERRRSVPLLVGAASDGRSVEEVLWVVGHGVSEASRASRDRRWVSFEWVAE